MAFIEVLFGSSWRLCLEVNSVKARFFFLSLFFVIMGNMHDVWRKVQHGVI